MAPHSSTELSRSGEQQERITIAFLALAWIFILLRIWTRTRIISNFGWDDSTMILAGLMFTVFCASVFYIDANGGGTHVTEFAHLRQLTKWVVVSEATYLMTMMILKMSLGIFFARIVIKPWHFILIYASVGINILSSLFAFFYCIFRCGPNLDKYALRQLLHQCTSQKFDLFVSYQSAAFNTLTDFVFLVLPMFILWDANMDRKSRFSVGFILCLAALGCICSIVRFRYVPGLTEVDDFFWNAVNISIWSTIEAGTSIVAGCLATLRPLLKRVFREIKERSSVSVFIKQISKSMRSGSTANASSNASSTPHYSTMITNPARVARRNKGRRGTIDTEDPDFMEFLAMPSHDVHTLDSATGLECKSTESIPGRARETESSDCHRPPTKQETASDSGEKRRQSIHGSYVATASRDTAAKRPISEPILPRIYNPSI